METLRFLRLRQIFDEASKLPFAERDAFLEQVCQGDKMLLAEARQLLEADQGYSQSALGVPGAGAAGPTVGPYRLLRQIGSGGMGVVYLAVRDDGAFRKHVALKLLRSAQATPDLVQRFHQERQVLANLDHPNIARILDGGQTPDGLPYYVMEYVEGQPLNQFCDAQMLDLADRIRLLQQVVHAVHYLHENLVVHRDLKHSNILVTADGVVKLLDFGIAKVQAPILQGMDLTSPDVRVLTPNYASPEQLIGAPISRASDIYSLGVLLYELLTGRLPHATPSDKVTKDPPPPSANIREDLQRTPETTAQLRRRLVGDLDQIVLLCLRRDPRHRYTTAAVLADDLQRFLDGRSVIARREAFPALAMRYLKRNRIAVGVAAVVLVVCGIGGRAALQAHNQVIALQQREAQVKKILDDLDKQKSTPSNAHGRPARHEANGGASMTPTVESLRRLREALQSYLGETPGMAATAEARGLLGRARQYLDSLRPYASADHLLATEIATTYQQLGSLYPPGYREDSLAALQSAASLLAGIAGGNPSDGPHRVQWAALAEQIRGLGGAVPTPPPPPPIGRAQRPSEETAPLRRVAIDTPITTAVIPTLPPATAQTADRTEQDDLRRRMISAQGKVRAAEEAMEGLTENARRMGQSVHPNIVQARNQMKLALDTAQDDLERGDFAAAREYIDSAEAFALKVLKAGGR